jgi:hypothetical protein
VQLTKILPILCRMDHSTTTLHLDPYLGNYEQAWRQLQSLIELCRMLNHECTEVLELLTPTGQCGPHETCA